MAFVGFGKSALEGEKIMILHKSILRVALALRKKNRTFDMLMGSSVPPRKRFIQTNAKKVQNLDI